MHVETLHRDLGRSGVEVLVFQFSGFSAVHRVGPFAAELLHVEPLGALSDLFVGREGHFAVFHFRVTQQLLHRTHDLGDAGFVVGAEQRGAVRAHDAVLHLRLHVLSGRVG